ncbi:hypothetical protein L593_07405 [Salinarchaeum sp. Harcht-Bsk1]|uniref:DUF7576 family protein n=1 Tax=Salinarchaeum sp. Harcht-Bsk1 TaxID=1333523 RepID=UPI000342280D|nr:hypothetical protein [Salinarchaeum sp. Harcht-Bsk1]AGN01426.1 hypothetical protein L593_07405 [Salinarchaeum sp. Harcht-Bsk1]
MAESSVDEGPIQSVSTRIRLDGGSGECEACGGSIEGGERFKVAAVRTGGRIVYHDFCGGDCIDNWQTA